MKIKHRYVINRFKKGYNDCYKNNREENIEGLITDQGDSNINIFLLKEH